MLILQNNAGTFGSVAAGLEGLICPFSFSVQQGTGFPACGLYSDVILQPPQIFVLFLPLPDKLLSVLTDQLVSAGICSGAAHKYTHQKYFHFGPVYHGYRGYIFQKITILHQTNEMDFDIEMLGLSLYNYSEKCLLGMQSWTLSIKKVIAKDGGCSTNTSGHIKGMFSGRKNCQKRCIFSGEICKVLGLQLLLMLPGCRLRLLYSLYLSLS